MSNTIEQLIDEIVDINHTIFDCLYDTFGAELFGELLDNQIHVVEELRRKLKIKK